MITTHFHQYRRGLHDTHQIAFSLVCHWGKQRAAKAWARGESLPAACQSRDLNAKNKHAFAQLLVPSMWVAGMAITGSSRNINIIINKVNEQRRWQQRRRQRRLIGRHNAMVLCHASPAEQ